VDRRGAAAASGPVGIVFQEPLLFPWLTVAENVALGLRYRANRTRCAGESVDQVLRDLGLASIAHAYPGELSGGQAQRTNLARTIVTRPAILLLDEPFSALDPGTRATLQDWLLGIVRRRRLTVVLVTHDVEEALYLGDRLALLSSRPSTVVGTWVVGRHLAAGENGRSGGSGRASDERREAIRREVLARYQADAPAAPSPADWMI
jgi:sulfate transport system ATP-binding protein/sulfonate transport system ATP-binding protein